MTVFVIILILLVNIALELYSVYLRREIKKCKRQIEEMLSELYGGA